MKIKLTFTYNRLHLLNKGWGFLDIIPAALKPHEKASFTIVNEVCKSLRGKEENLLFNRKPDKEYSISLKYHQAYFYEKYLRSILPYLGDEATNNAAQQTADYLNQKLA